MKNQTFKIELGSLCSWTKERSRCISAQNKRIGHVHTFSYAFL